MTKLKNKPANEERLEQHRKENQLAQAERSLQLIARANLAILRDMQESGELDKLPPAPVVGLTDADTLPRVSRRERLRDTPSTNRQTIDPDRSRFWLLDDIYPCALTTDQGYFAYRIPKDEDHILMTPGKTDYLYYGCGVRIPAWRVTFSQVHNTMQALLDSAREVVCAELEAAGQADRQSKAA